MPAATLLPLVRTGFVGERVTANATTLHAQLADPQVLPEADRFMHLVAVSELSQTVIDLSRAHDADADVVVNLFTDAPDVVVEALQDAFLNTCFVGVFTLVVSGIDIEERLDDLIRTAASITPAGQLLRDLLTDPRRRLRPLGTPNTWPPGLPGIPAKLLITAEGLRRKGCANAVRGALQRWGSAVAEQTPYYLNGTIEQLDPADGCPGEQMTIRGHGFGAAAGATVAFTGPDGHAALCTDAQILQWTDTEIRLTIPGDARRGPVGILRSPAGGGPTIAEVASTAIGELIACFGPNAAQRLTTAAAKVLPPVTPPSPAADGANQFMGGPPVIEAFVAAPSGMLWPGRRCELRWLVNGADNIEISARNVPGSPPQELPAVPGPLTFPQGSVTVSVPGSHPWRGEYVLRARNRCTRRAGTATERALPFEMVLRRGLVLGGGGSRGDFQTGALLYLYDEKGYRPDAIASTSVGSINAVDLVMGDDAASPTSPARSAASRLAATWLSLNTDADMWSEEEWLSHVKAEIRSFLMKLSFNLLFFPLDWVAVGLFASGTATYNDLKGMFDKPRARGVRALFNINPIEARARATYDQTRTDASGIQLRMVAVSVETSELVLIDETGGLRLRGEQPVRPATVPPANPTDVVDGAVASATMPGIFPARRLGDHMCVDGGVREVVPVQVAVRELGCNEVIAIRCSARPEMLPTDPARTFLEVAGRSVLDISYDEIADDDVDPFGGFGEGVSVRTIRPSMNLHDPMVIEPGLIRITMDYGWMRAADTLDVPIDQRRYAMELSDSITLLRVQNWRQAWAANGQVTPDAHRDFGALLSNGVSPPATTQIRPVPMPEAVDAIRDNCRRIRFQLQQRLFIGAPTPPTAVRSAWFTQWERIAPAAVGTPWDEFVSTAGTRPAEAPLAPI